MAIKNWSGWTIGSLWLTWLVLILAVARANRQPPSPQMYTSTAVAADTLSDSQRVVAFYLLREKASDTIAVTPRFAALSRLSIDTVARTRDSLWRVLGLPSRLTKAQSDSIGAYFLLGLHPVAENIATSLSSPTLWWTLGLQIFGLFLIPVALLIVVTLKWYLPRVIAKARGI